MKKPSVLLLEFNELSPTLTDQFIKLGKLPNFAKLKSQSKVFITDAEEETVNLEPWIQWITVHSGLSYEEHGIFNLGDGHKLKAPTLSQILSEHDLLVWLCGSMNIPIAEDINGFVIPDAWNTSATPQPSELSTYWNFIRTNVQEHTNDNVPLSKKDYLMFLKFMMSHGLSISTVVAILKQGIEQKVTGKGRWKKATLLNRIQWDLFKWIYKKHQPNFSTFFLNSTAHYQHAYWRYFAPNSFKVQPTAEELDDYGDAILFGYQEMDDIIGKTFDMVPDDTTIILCTALSQQPCLTYEDQGGKTFYRPHDFKKLFEVIGLKGLASHQSVMSEEFRLYFENKSYADEAEALLKRFTVEGQPLFKVRSEDISLYTGCSIFTPLPNSATISRAGSDKEILFSDVFYEAPQTVRSGMHHPDGMLWVKSPQVSPELADEKLSLRAVAPMVLQLFDIKPQDSMLKNPTL
ncbi:MAG: hypothetical protein V3U78_10215 [Thiotrichaceae bacterium]